MKGWQIFCAFVIFFSVSAVPCFGVSGDSLKTVEDSSAQSIVSGMSGKASRGIANVATGWLELPMQIYVASKEGDTAKAVFLGPLMGIGMMVARTVAGAVELATFFVPYPGFYDPLIDPPYVWEEKK